MEWVDGNLGSKLTMKYPAIWLMGEGAHGEVLSIAFAGEGQHQDAGGKAVHVAPNTSSVITSKSISKNGGRAGYRGLLEVAKGAHGAKSKVVCDALILDEESRSDTYPYIRIDENDVSIEHEATVSKIGEEQLFYLMSRGLSEAEASAMIVSGFVEPITKELPLEYAVEMNRLIQLQMEGSCRIGRCTSSARISSRCRFAISRSRRRGTATRSGSRRSPRAAGPSSSSARTSASYLIDPTNIGQEFSGPHTSYIALRVPDVEEARKELEGRGIEFEGEIFDTGVCHMAFFRDPDGNSLMLHRRYAPRD